MINKQINEQKKLITLATKVIFKLNIHIFSKKKLFLGQLYYITRGFKVRVRVESGWPPTRQFFGFAGSGSTRFPSLLLRNVQSSLAGEIYKARISSKWCAPRHRGECENWLFAGASLTRMQALIGRGRRFFSSSISSTSECLIALR